MRTDTPRPRVLFVNRSYWPDAEATGQLLTELCEDLAGQFEITVLCGQPNSNPAQVAFRRRGYDQQRGVRIRRVWNAKFPKYRFIGRAVNLLSFLVTACLASLSMARPDIVVVETDPPLLCLLGAVLRRWHGCKLVVYLQDIYPDIAVALGKLPDGWFARRLRALFFSVYRSADRVIVLSEDMRALLIESNVPADRIVVVPNWIDTTRIRPLKTDNSFRAAQQLAGQFVVMYSGNVGFCQRLEDVLAAAVLLRNRPDIRLLIIGEGALKAQLEAQARQAQLTNVIFLPYQPKSQLAESLSAADLHIVPVDVRVTRFLMPSKLYGVLASGTPLVAIAPESCDLATVTREGGCGLVVPPGNPEALAAAIRCAADGAVPLDEMGRAGRELAVREYDRPIITARFGVILDALLGRSEHELASTDYASLSNHPVINTTASQVISVPCEQN